MILGYHHLTKHPYCHIVYHPFNQELQKAPTRAIDPYQSSHGLIPIQESLRCSKQRNIWGIWRWVGGLGLLVGCGVKQLPNKIQVDELWYIVHDSSLFTGKKHLDTVYMSKSLHSRLLLLYLWWCWRGGGGELFLYSPKEYHDTSFESWFWPVMGVLAFSHLLRAPPSVFWRG